MENREIVINADGTMVENGSDPVVNIPYDTFQSFLGRYYIGRTPPLALRGNCHCWGGVANPNNSPANIYIDSISCTNTTGILLNSRIWINPSLFPLGRIGVSPIVTPANTTNDPTPLPNGLISFAQNLRFLPFNGVGLLLRHIRPCSTLTVDFGGKVIIPPGGSCICFVCATEGPSACCEVSCRWWEEPV